MLPTTRGVQGSLLSGAGFRASDREVSATMSELILTSVDRGVGVITLNRPEKHNAINDDMGDQFLDAIRWADQSPEVRCVLIRAEGPSFSSGRDTSQMGQRSAGESDFTFIRRHQEMRVIQHDSVKPTVVAVHGHAVGGAFEIVLNADIRVCATDVRMGFPEVSYGIMTDTGGAPLATIVAGPSRAKWLLMTGELIDADRALAWGIADEVVAPERLDETALNLAVKIASGPPLAISMIKQVVDGMWHGQWHAGLRAELLAQSTLFKSQDYAEAKAARLEKRAPNYQGL
jgi:enoyl-CoA hydratase/carnithine racemase